MTPPPPVAGPLPERAVPLAAAASVLRGDVHFLSYLHDGSGARLTFAGLLGSRKNQTWPFHGGHDVVSAVDDQGGSYAVYLGSSGDDGRNWTGELLLDPEPPPDIKWLELEDGHTRIDLTGEPPAPDIAISPTGLSPGEHYLHRLAATVLASGHADDEAEIIGALRTAEALPPDSELPGQLAALPDERPGLPEHWRLAPVPARSTPAYGGLAVRLPELDDIRITLAGLHVDSGGECHLHTHMRATDLAMANPVPFLLWLRDAEGWHVTEPRSGGSSDEEASWEYAVLPALRPSGWVEVLVLGRTHQLRARLTVRWSPHAGS